ncbi:hypothetical protein JCM9534A_75080 [Catenuloplanes indicus JCM 9534]
MLAQAERVREALPRVQVDAFAGQRAEHVAVADRAGDLVERAADPVDRVELAAGGLGDEDRGGARHSRGLQRAGEDHRVDRVGHRAVEVEHAARYRDETAVRTDQLKVAGARHVALLTRRDQTPGAPMRDLRRAQRHGSPLIYIN